MTIIVKGIDTVDDNGKPYLRKDIDQWYMKQVDGGDRIQLTLFVEALALIQKREMDNPLSYFRLAAIHSAPWCEWDDVPQPPKNPPDDPKRIPGYCVHNNYTFPTWHRAYMLLYERTLYDAMYEWIGENVPSDHQKRWKREADKWRLPYWDFARYADRPQSTANAFEYDISHDKLRLPILSMMPNVRIKVFPKGKNYTKIESRPNPLYKFETPNLMGEFPEPYKIKGEDIPEETVKDKEFPDDKSKEKVVNPPFTYPWDKCSATTKYGILDGFNANVWADGGQNWLRANYALNEHPYYGPKDKGPNGEKPVPTVQDLVFRMFLYGLDSWGAFSTSRYASDHPEPPKEVKPKSAGSKMYSSSLEQDAKNAVNLEFIHNNLHNFVGGTQFLRPPKEGIHLWGAGHMSSVNMAAFDPIFFIYHNNIDRLTAMWQTLNWEKWFDDKYSRKTRANDLLPFHKDDDGNFFKSDCVQNWRDLGYDYEILQGRDPKNPKDQLSLLLDIDKLYGQWTRDLFKDLPTDKEDKDGGGNNKGDDNHDDGDDFVITVIYDKFALNGAPYKINVFLDGPRNYGGPESEGFVASIYNFSSSLDSGNCSNCKQQKEEGSLCIAQVPATVPMRNHRKNKNKDNLSEDTPQPVYLALNNLGNPVQMKVQIELHRSPRSYYKHFVPPTEDKEKLKYEFVKPGRQANEVFDDLASNISSI